MTSILFLAILGGLDFFSVMAGSSWLGLLGLLVGFAGWWSTGSLLRKNAKTQKSNALNANSTNGETTRSGDSLRGILPSLITSRTLPRMAKTAGKVFALIVVGGFLGWFSNDLWGFYWTRPYANVRVLQKYSDFAFRFQPAEAQPFEGNFCTHKPPGIRVNDVLSLVELNRATGCVKVHVFAARDSQGWPIQVAKGN